MTSSSSEETASTSIIRQTWDADADTYDDMWGHGLKTELETTAWSRLLARMFPPDEPFTIIDIGCGTGVVSLLLAELGHQVIGLDLSAEMLRVCQSQADARGLTNLHLVAGDAEQLRDDIGPADALVSRHVLWTLRYPEAALKAWVQLTKPGGRVTSFDGLWSTEAADFSHYPADIDMLLPLQRVRASIPPATYGDGPD